MVVSRVGLSVTAPAYAGPAPDSKQDFAARVDVIAVSAAVTVR